jgi:hypothetical protein
MLVGMMVASPSHSLELGDPADACDAISPSAAANCRPRDHATIASGAWGKRVRAGSRRERRGCNRGIPWIDSLNFGC